MYVEMRLIPCLLVFLLCSIKISFPQALNTISNIFKPCQYSRVIITDETRLFFSTASSTNGSDLNVDLVDGHQTTWSEEYFSCRLQRYANAYLAEGMKAALKYLPLSKQKHVLECCNATVSYLRLLTTEEERIDSLVASVYMGLYSVRLSFLDVMVAAKLTPSKETSADQATTISVLLPRVTLKLTLTTEYKRKSYMLFKTLRNVAARISVVDKPEIQPIADPNHRYDVEAIDQNMRSHLEQIFNSIDLFTYLISLRNIYNSFMGFVDIHLFDPAPFLPILQILDYEANEINERKRSFKPRPVNRAGYNTTKVLASSTSRSYNRTRSYPYNTRAMFGN